MQNSKIKVCFFLPAATSMIIQMQLEGYLYGVTFECPSDKSRVVRSYIESNNYSSEELTGLNRDKKHKE